MSSFYKQLIFISLGIAILMIGGLAIWAATAGGNLKINPILGHDLDLNGLYYGQAGNNTVHDITTQDISISAWVKVDVGSGATQAIFNKTSSSFAGYLGYTLYLGGGAGYPTIRMNDNTNGSGHNLGAIAYTDIRDNKWHHITGVIDRATGTNNKMFIDGVDRTSYRWTDAGFTSPTNSYTLNLGDAAGAGTYRFDGQIRDVKLYYAAGDHWSDAQVLYQAQHPFDYTANAGTMTDYWRLDEGTGTTLYGKVNNLTLSNVLAWTTQPKIKMVKQENTTTTSNNPVGWWKMDEGSGISAYDSSGNGYTGTLTNSPTWTTGKLGKGLSFASASSQYVSIGTGLGKPTNWTESFWIKPNSWLRCGIMSEDSGGAMANAWGWSVAVNGQAYVYVSNGVIGQAWNAEAYNSTNYPSTSWTHVVVSVDGSNIRYYRNGSLATSTAQAYSMGGTPASFSIGRDGAWAGDYCNGLIDDVRIYNRALTAGEVAQMYNSTKDGYLGNIKVSTGLVGYWKLDDNNALTSVIDYSGKGNTGTAYSGTATTTSVLSTSTAMIGRAFAFNGSNNFVNVNASNNLNITGNTITLEAWVKLGVAIGSQNQYAAIIEKPAGSDSIWMLYVRNDLGIRMWVDGLAAGITSASTTAGVWYHITGTYDGSNIKIYLNGFLVNTTAKTGAITATPSGNLSIGRRSVGLSYFTGLIDEVKIWNYARSAEQIGQDYIRGLKGLP